MINEALVRSFLTLARTRNVTEAARQLYLSQQAVSKHLARLEEDLGCTLFSRERGSMALTEQGEIYFEAFSQIEDTLAEARDRVKRMRTAEDSRLVISHLDLLDVYRIFKPIYQDFTAACPDVRLVYRSTSDWATAEQLLEGRVDLDEYFRVQAGYAGLLRTWLTAICQWDDVMYGTDWPIVNLGEYIGFIRRLVPETHWEPVFFDNANRIYGLGL